MTLDVPPTRVRHVKTPRPKRLIRFFSAQRAALHTHSRKQPKNAEVRLAAPAQPLERLLKASANDQDCGSPHKLTLERINRRKRLRAERGTRTVLLGNFQDCGIHTATAWDARLGAKSQCVHATNLIPAVLLLQCVNASSPPYWKANSSSLSLWESQPIRSNQSSTLHQCDHPV